MDWFISRNPKNANGLAGFVVALCTTASFLFFSPTLHAATQIDETVRAFLHESASKEATHIPVLVIYKNRAKLPPVSSHPMFHARVEQELIAHTKNEQVRLFSNEKLQSATGIKAAWLVNGTFATLNRTQLQIVIQSNLAKSIFFSQSKVKMKAEPIAAAAVAATSMTYGLKKIGIADVRTQFPHLDGTGIRIGILDTGIDDTHPDLKGKLKAYSDFSPAKNPNPEDPFDHGTHVAGTIAGGSASKTSIGVAPKVDLVVGRVFDGNGDSTKEGLILAMQWMADPDGDAKTSDFPLAVNNSWSDDEPFNTRDPIDDPFCIAIDNWISLGIVPIFTAGNTGPRSGSTNTPGACPNALTVGATESTDRSPHFSSTGPAMWKSSQIVKPDVVAPGYKIYSCEAGGGYTEKTGTSFAAPHVTGAMALLLQAKPNLTVDQAVKTLIDGVLDLGDPGQDNIFGWGRIDVLKSVQ